MKKIIMVMCALMMGFILTACKGNQNQEQPTSNEIEQSNELIDSDDSLEESVITPQVPEKTKTVVNAGTSVSVDPSIPESLREYAIQFKTSDGVLLSGLVLGEGSKGVTLGHANGWNIGSWLPFAKRLAEHGYQVVLWSYRNNEPSGEATGEGFFRLDLDVLAAVDVLVERGVTEIVSIGASLGGTSSAVAAPTIPELVGLALLSSPRKFGEPAKISALDAVKTLNVPSFFAVSNDDPTGDYLSEIEALYEASASEQKQLVVIDDYEHGTDMLSDTPQGQQLTEQLWSFVTERLGEPDSK